MVGSKVDNDHETYPSVWMDYANEYKMQFCLAHPTISKLQKLFGTAGLPPMLKNHFLSWLYEPIMNGLGWTWWGSIFGLWNLKLKPLNLWSGYIFWSVMQVTHTIFIAKQVTKNTTRSMTYQSQFANEGCEWDELEHQSISNWLSFPWSSMTSCQHSKMPQPQEWILSTRRPMTQLSLRQRSCYPLPVHQ